MRNADSRKGEPEPSAKPIPVSRHQRGRKAYAIFFDIRFKILFDRKSDIFEEAYLLDFPFTRLFRKFGIRIQENTVSLPIDPVFPFGLGEHCLERKRIAHGKIPVIRQNESDSQIRVLLIHR